MKQRFVKTILTLINDHLFANSESNNEYIRLDKEGIERRVAAAYDLRSRYVHTGIDFAEWITLSRLDNSEVQYGTPEVEDKKFASIIARAPTYFGMERIMRFCLLRFIHLEGIAIDSRLDDD